MMKTVRIQIAILILIFATPLLSQDTLYLSIGRLVEQLKNDNLEIKKATLKSKMADAAYTQSKEWWLPELFVGTTLHQLDGSTINGDGRFFTDVDRQSRWFGGEVSFSWDIGQGIYNSKVKNLEARSAEAMSAAKQNNAVLNGIEKYYQLLQTAAQKSIIEEIAKMKSDLISQLQVQVDAGLRLESELLLAQSQNARLNAQIIAVENEYMQSMSEILQVLNLEGNYVLQFDASELSQTKELSTLITTEKEHPIITAYKLGEAAKAKKESAVVNSILIPDAGLRYNMGPFGENYSDNILTRSFNGYIGWNIPIGLLVYGGEKKMAAAERELATIEIDQQQTQIKNEVRTLKGQLSNLGRVLTIAKKGSDFAKQALLQATERQTAGIGTAYEILLAQEEYVLAQTLYVQSLASYKIGEYRLKEAMGERL